MAVSEIQPQSRLKAKLQEVLGLDLRALALFRIGLALVVLADLMLRSQFLMAHYSDDGILPRTAAEQLIQPWYWSIHFISGETWVQGILFCLAGLIALALLVGYRTRLATIATWATVISLHNRNPALLFANERTVSAEEKQTVEKIIALQESCFLKNK